MKMGKYEYNVLPAPRRAKRAKGVKGEPAKFAHALTELMNLQAAEGWEYFKSETLPMESKSGVFKGVTESFQCVLVFRRSLEDEDQGEIVSMTPPVQTIPDPVIEAPKEPDKMEPLRTVEPEAVAEKKPLSFDEDNMDPLKNLVEDHRGPRTPDNT
jgi:hypothetical protein